MNIFGGIGSSREKTEDDYYSNAQREYADELYAELIPHLQAAWNRRSGGTALLDAVRKVRDGLREASKIDYNSRQVREEMAETADDLTRIIDEHKEAE